MSWCSVPGGVVNSSWVVVTTSSSAASIQSSILMDVEAMEASIDVLNVGTDAHQTEIFVSLAVVTKPAFSTAELVGPGGEGEGLLELDCSSGSISAAWVGDGACGIPGLSLGCLIAVNATPIPAINRLGGDCRCESSN